MMMHARALVGALAAGAAAIVWSGPPVAAQPAPMPTPIPAMTPAGGMSPMGQPMTPIPLTPGPQESTTPTPAPNASPSAQAVTPEDPKVTARVTAAFQAWQRGRLDRSEYSPQANGTYIDAFVAAVAPDLAAVGPLRQALYRWSSPLLGDRVYRYDLMAEAGDVSVLYALDAGGRTDGVVFTPLVFRAAATP